MNEAKFYSREIERIINGMPVSEGAGVNLLRILTQDLQKRLDPFLMLDEFRSDDPRDYIAGFPSHPHRGFQTVTYMLAGRMRHRDSAGNEGLLSPGGVQWMNTGRGLVHSELPEQQDGLMHGFQLWVNLPAARKMGPPGYRDIPASDIPGYTTAEGVGVRVIAGEQGGVRGAVEEADTEPLYLDLTIPAGGGFAVALPEGHNAFLYVYQGAVEVGGQAARVDNRQMAILNNPEQSDGVLLRAKEEAGLLVIAGRPLRESIAQWGPFVMNTREEVEQAVQDYQRGLF